MLVQQQKHIQEQILGRIVPEPIASARPWENKSKTSLNAAALAQDADQQQNSAINHVIAFKNTINHVSAATKTHSGTNSGPNRARIPRMRSPLKNHGKTPLNALVLGQGAH